MAAKPRNVSEFGDFQTPPELCKQICELLAAEGLNPAHVLEPTCGKGGFLVAAAEVFTEAKLTGLEINSTHLDQAQLALRNSSSRVQLHQGSFFEAEWPNILGAETARLLVLGNPPWVTSAELGVLQSSNLPQKSNFQGLSGIDAMTGKSNFDISEWMLLRYLDWLERSGGWIAVLVKTAVARKVLMSAWKRRYPIADAAIYRIDAMRHFSAAVDACLFLARVEPGKCIADCRVYERLEAPAPDHVMGYHDGLMITDVGAYKSCGDLAGPDPHYVWRSGVKHDCSRVMEFTSDGGVLANGSGERVQLEDEFLFPLLKSSDVHKGKALGHRYMLVPQRSVGECTSHIESRAPQTWSYLRSHADQLGARGSSIYRNRAEFSVFGVGPYTFAPWKVAISGFYKALRFSVVGSIGPTPAVFDDTVYFLPAYSEEEAAFLADILNGPIAQSFYGSMVFWEDKRPITVDLLKRLNLRKLASKVGRLAEYERFISTRTGDLFTATAA
ncbi:N-6 DNA methylase [Brevundimonas diminuta]